MKVSVWVSDVLPPARATTTRVYRPGRSVFARERRPLNAIPFRERVLADARRALRELADEVLE